MKKKLRCGVIGATGMVGLKFLELLSEHPWIEVVVVAASERSAGQSMKLKVPIEIQTRIDRSILELVIQNASDVKTIAPQVDFIFCAIDLPKDKIIELEESYAKHEVVVVSNNSAMRWHDDVPMIVPEINGVKHLKILEIQKQRLATTKGCIVVKPNCAAQAYMALLDALVDTILIEDVSVSLMQAISGSGKHLYDVPEIHDNILPLIGEAKKSILEPLKIFGKIIKGKIVFDNLPISATSYRVGVEDGHLANIFIRVEPRQKNITERIKILFESYKPLQIYCLPSSPKVVINYLGDDVYPIPKEHANNQGGMEFTCGALEYNKKSGIIRVTGLIHNLIRGAAGGAVLTAELMIKLGYITSKF